MTSPLQTISMARVAPRPLLLPLQQLYLATGTGTRAAAGPAISAPSPAAMPPAAAARRCSWRYPALQLQELWLLLAVDLLRVAAWW